MQSLKLLAPPPLAVLSAVSGLRVAVPSLSQQLIVGLAELVLLLVFALQKYGTGQVRLSAVHAVRVRHG